VTSTEPTWRAISEPDLPSLVALTKRVLAEDGGLPVAGDEPFLRRRYLDGVIASTAAFMDADLVAAAAVRPVGDGTIAASVGRIAAGVGMVDPVWRERGLGGHLLDWALTQAGDVPVRMETESLTPAADALMHDRGLRQTFAEDVMRFDLVQEPPAVHPPADVMLIEWSSELGNRFFGVYEAAFRERPGFPGWSAGQWIEWISDDEDFAPEWTLLATREGTDLGFVASARGAWIVQVGTTAAARGIKIGAALTAEALRRMRAGGETEALLDVNVDNPGAIRVYERLGFAHIGRRARYERVT